MSTLFTFAPANDHTLSGHPENATRGTAVLNLLRKSGVLPDLKQVVPLSATSRQLIQVHHFSLVERLEAVSLRGGGSLDQDTYATAESFALASLAAGSAAQAVDLIMAGEADNGYLFLRPPGHHAEYRHSGGFCLFNNVAFAARQAQLVHKLKRVAIIDFDVHHGNGTQDIFYRDADTLFVSVHQFGRYFYPGTGAAQEMGELRGWGYTLNVPLPPGVGDVGYGQIFDDVIYPKLRAFQPEFILVSAGYDAHWADPLASAALTLTGYVSLVRQLIEMAEDLCHGRVLFVQEGGYLLDALACGVLNTLYALLGRDQIRDPLGPFPHRETDISDLVTGIHKMHLKK
jgi:acetoin utilization deacetylase AcuC-like enzyme